MRQKIRGILGHHLDGNDKDYEKAIDKILRLFDVSGNEAIQSENKKESEVAVCQDCNGKGRWEYEENKWIRCYDCNGTGQTDC